MSFEPYIKKGLIKRQGANFRQIEKQIIRAKKDLMTARLIFNNDPEWGAAITYHAMLRAGRALIFSKGYLPSDGRQHRTVVELTHELLGRDYSLLADRFERMRRKRNIFFYESDTFGTITEAKNALNAASQLLDAIEDTIRQENPQLHLNLG